jgi:mono/diheme cytochrome c family protein
MANGSKTLLLGERRMKRAAWMVAAVLIAWPMGAPAQPGGSSLTGTQRLGMRLFNQSCRVWHTKPQIGSPLYGPALSRQSAGGQEVTMRQIISNGTPRMPGFKHHFQPAQIDAIVAYLKTVPAPAP